MPLLMAKQQEEPSRVTAHGPVALTPNLPFVACELCRERMSVFPILCTVLSVPTWEMIGRPGWIISIRTDLRQCKQTKG